MPGIDCRRFAGVVAVFQKEHRELLASRSTVLLWVACALFVGLVTAIVSLATAQPEREVGVQFLEVGAGLVATVVGPLAVANGAPAVAGERDRGTLRLLLAQPCTRVAVVAGKLLARAAVAVVPTLAVLIVLATLGLVAESPLARGVVAFGGATVGLTVAYVSVAVGASAVFRTGNRALVVSVGTWLVATFAWQRVVGLAGRLLLPDGGSAARAWLALASAAEPRAASLLVASVALPGQSTSPDPLPPWLPAPLLGTVVLAVWTVVPPVLGVWRFGRGDA